jgi:uncharacterized delta-60 repeat protein
MIAACAGCQFAIPSSYAARGTTLDPAFGKDGAVIAQPLPRMASAATSVAVQPNGDALVGGSAGPSQGGGPGPGSIGFVMRLLPGGRLDSSFGSSGVATVASGSSVTQVATDPRGGIFVLANSLTLLDQSGARDAAYGDGGSAVLPEAFLADRFAVEPDGRVALIGTVLRADGTSAPAVVRLTPQGQPDQSFGTNGLVVLPPPADPSARPLTSVSPGGLVVQPDGDILLTLRGSPEAPPSTLTFPASVLERVTTNGALDTGFGHDGQAFIVGSGETVGAFDPLLTSSGAVLVAVIGSGGTGAIQSPLIWATSADGQTLSHALELTPEYVSVGAFAALPHGGYLALDDDDDGFAGVNLSEMAFATDGSTTSVGGALGYQIPLTFPDGASVTDSLLAVQPDGKLLLAGTAPAANGMQEVFVARLLGVSSQAIVGLPRQRIRRSSRAVTVGLKCSAAEPCVGRATLLRRSGPRQTGRILGSGSFSIAAGHLRRVALRLTHAGFVDLSRRVPTPVILRLAVANGPTRSAIVVVPAAHL